VEKDTKTIAAASCHCGGAVNDAHLLPNVSGKSPSSTACPSHAQSNGARVKAPGQLYFTLYTCKIKRRHTVTRPHKSDHSLSYHVLLPRTEKWVTVQRMKWSTRTIGDSEMKVTADRKKPSIHL